MFLLRFVYKNVEMVKEHIMLDRIKMCKENAKFNQLLSYSILLH